jgi:tetratricopeptide (TPR) repeat protein
MAIALAVSIVDVIGWWTWRRMVDSVAENSALGVSRFSTDRCLALPSTVHRSRSMTPSDFAGAPRDALVTVLNRVSNLQLRWFPTDPAGFENRSRAALLADRVEDGLGDIAGALERDPTSPALHRLGALVLHRMGRRQDCLDHLAEAQAIAGGMPGPVVDLTTEEKEWMGLESLRRRLDRYPRQRVSAALDLAREMKRRGDVEESVAMLEALSPHPEVEVELARWDLEWGRVDSASRRLESVTGRVALPSGIRVRAWALLAEVRDQAGDSDGALSAAHQALSLEPGSTAPYVALAGLAERRGDYLAALEHLRRAWGVAPTNIPLLLRIAGVAERAGRTSDARLALERAVQVDPGSPELAARLVEFHLGRGQFMEAAMRLSRALDRHPIDRRLLELADRLRREVGRTER